MFCDGCGSEVQAGQSYCSKCGKQIIGSIPVMRAHTRVEEHIRLLAILWFAVSALTALGGIALVIVANTVFAPESGIRAPAFLHPMLGVLGILILGKGAVGFLTGWGLLHRESWGRVLALIMGFLSLFNVPFGTAVGVYTLWVLLPGDSEREYEHLVAQRAVA